MPLRPKPEGWTSPYAPGHLDPKICSVTDLLTDWFNALEDGTAGQRLPHPRYQRRNGRSPWSDAELETLIEVIDANIDRELSWAGRNRQMNCQAGAGFHRLAPPQRLALAQQLDELLARAEASGQPTES